MKFSTVLCASASLMAMASSAMAQQAPATAPSADASAPAPATSDTVVVTGSRIIRNGYAAPTPVTVASAAQLQASTPTDIPDALNKLPVFDGSTVSAAGSSVNAVGGNYLNLRDFGVNRTLVLMNGLRVPPTNFNGQVDANTIPEMLLQRVDVVTGGASAVYGSDAVTGVVNFIMDTHFNGLKAQADAGISQQGDAASTRYGIAVGGDVFNLGHFEGSFEHFQEGGLLHDQRSYGQTQPVYAGTGSISNPYTVVSNPTIAKSAFGGYVTSGPFAGQQFLANGQLGPYTPGAATASANLNVGGNGAYYNNEPLYAPQNMNQLYGRFDRDLTGDISAFVQVSDSWTGDTERDSNWSPQTLTFYGGNPFLPASAQAQLASGQSFNATIFPRDLELMSQLTQLSTSISVTAGLTGKLLDNYNWELSYTHGESIFRSSLSNNINVPNFLAAIDAVPGPNGPVCYVSTTANASRYPGCVPLDVFGVGNESAAAEAYIFQTTQFQVVNAMDDYVGSLSGSPVSDWAGPISVALNGEFRQQSLAESTNASPLTPVSFTGLRDVPTPAPSATYAYATVAPQQAANSVWEVSGETVVPLAKDLPLIKAFDISGAVRYTDYSTSGSATTWKAGLDYQPIDDVRIRATESRDIRAPTLYDLYAGQSSILQNLNDPVSGKGAVVSITTEGNPNLVPEVAMTTTAGVVYSPSWLPRFRMSVDYYNITMDNAITSLSGSNAGLLSECQTTPTAPLCSLLIVRGNGPNAFPTAVYSESVNAAKTWTNGVDVEASYNLPLSDLYQPLPGNLTTRLLYSYQPTLDVQNFAGAPIGNAAGSVGLGGTPGSAGASALSTNRVSLFLTYNLGPFTVDWQSRYYSALKRSGTPGQYFAQGSLPAYSLSDVNLNYRFKVDEHTFNAFFNVQNLFNTPPRVVPNIQASGLPGFSTPIVTGDDGIGRYFTVGLKFNY